MRFFDLSQPLFDGCPNCPAHPPVQVAIVATHARDDWQMEMLTLASHTGTHLDAPLHKLAGGRSIDAYPLEAFAGRPFVADFTDLAPDHAITAADLQNRLPAEISDGIVLLNTGWGAKRAPTDEWKYHSPFLSSAGAAWLVEQRVRGVGIDHFSIGGTREPGNARTHEVLLGAGIWIVEELSFRAGWRDILPQATFQALPIFARGFSGAPCRAVLVHKSFTTEKL
jgi:kynurenine formamidase